VVDILKILSIADIHGSQYRLNILLKNIEKYSPDLVIICGDITQFGPKDVAINILNQIEVKTFAVHGNIDTKDVLMAIEDSNANNIHLKKIIFKNFSFIGLGGDINIPINTKINIKFDESFKKFDEVIDESTILVTHNPPYGLQDKLFLGFHAGSKFIKGIINQYNPLLVLCGHIHENPGYVKYKKTTIVNCSIGKKGGGALIALNKENKIKMLY
jgi:Icc-related predicted phosphoesterase